MLKGGKVVKMSEVYSPGTIGDRCNGDVEALDAMDLRTGYDFRLAAHRKSAVATFGRTQPDLIVGSPSCTAFSRAQNMNLHKVEPLKRAERLEEGILHLKICCALYRSQMKAGRYFLHEHPLGADSWKLPCIKELLTHGKVFLVRMDQCMAGLRSESDEGEELPAKKPTYFMTNSAVLADRLEMKCDQSHSHQSLLGKNRMEKAQTYPDKLCDIVIEAIYEQIQVDKKLEGIFDTNTRPVL